MIGPQSRLIRLPYQRRPHLQSHPVSVQLDSAHEYMSKRRRRRSEARFIVPLLYPKPTIQSGGDARFGAFSYLIPLRNRASISFQSLLERNDSPGRRYDNVRPRGLLEGKDNQLDRPMDVDGRAFTAIRGPKGDEAQNPAVPCARVK